MNHEQYSYWNWSEFSKQADELREGIQILELFSTS
jgi:hypothetical protein